MPKDPEALNTEYRPGLESKEGNSEGTREAASQNAPEEQSDRQPESGEGLIKDGQEKVKQPTVKNPIREVLETVAIALILALLIRTFAFEVFVVDGVSMETTLHDNERLLVNKFVYRFRSPRPGDIVVFKYPRDPRRDFIKRTIAVAGDTVEIRDGQVFVNGTPLAEDYITRAGHSDFPRFVVPPDSIFVLGDNRNNSQDSRVFGEVPLRNVKGKAFIRFWPLTRIRWFAAPVPAR